MSDTKPKNLQLALIGMFRAMLKTALAERVELKPYQRKQRVGDDHLRTGVLRFDSARGPAYHPLVIVNGRIQRDKAKWHVLPHARARRDASAKLQAELAEARKA